MANKDAVRFSINWGACIRCGACVAVCPHPQTFTSAFDTIAVDTPCTVACMRCEPVCPVTAISSAKVPSAAAQPASAT
jgi:formate hydrogenlyase subunit 6/NADH:ubiquinone oxidoreductase subunit I